MSEPITIELGWPDKVLSPNSNIDRRYKGAQRIAYRTDAFYASKVAKAPKMECEAVHCDVLFNPPDARKRDLDNMLGSIKYGIDGVSQAIGVDDYNWSYSIKRGEPVKGGKVILTITQIGESA